MSVKPHELDNPEKDQVLENREPHGAQKVADDISRVKTGKPDELEALRRRIAAAVATTAPKDPQPHCGDCYRRGWAAALRSLEW
jgi:hypothetical protein